MIDSYNRILTKLAQQDPVTEQELRTAKNMATLGRLAPIPIPGKSTAITALGAPEGRRMDTVLGADEGGRLGMLPGAAIGATGGAILGALGGGRALRRLDDALGGGMPEEAMMFAPVAGGAIGGLMGAVPGMMVGDAIGARAGIENRLREKRPGVPMSKEAMIEMYAPETGYIPPHYQTVLTKEAFLGGLGKMMTAKAGKNIGNMARQGLVSKGALTTQGTAGTFAQKAKNYASLYGNRAMGYAGKRLQNAGKFVANKGQQLTDYGRNVGKAGAEARNYTQSSIGSGLANAGKFLSKAVN